MAMKSNKMNFLMSNLTGKLLDYSKKDIDIRD